MIYVFLSLIYIQGADICFEFGKGILTCPGHAFEAADKLYPEFIF